MGSFDSPIGNKKFTGQSLKEFDIPDEENYEMQSVMKSRGQGYQSVDINNTTAYRDKISQMHEMDDSDQMSDIERQMKEARQSKLTGKTRLSEGAKRRIEMLVGMSRTTRQVEIGGNQWTFQTLSAREMRSAIMAASEFDGTVQGPYEIRRQLLAYSVTHVAGLEVSQFVGSNDLSARFDLIDSLDETLLNRLYDEYIIMSEDARQKFAIKNEEDVKEVVEDLKK